LRRTNTNCPRYHSNCAFLRHSGSIKPYAFTQQSRKGSTCGFADCLENSSPKLPPAHMAPLSSFRLRSYRPNRTLQWLAPPSDTPDSAISLWKFPHDSLRHRLCFLIIPYFSPFVKGNFKHFHLYIIRYGKNILKKRFVVIFVRLNVIFGTIPSQKQMV